MKQSPLISYLGGRKFIVALLIILSATALGLYGKMDSSALGIVFATVGAGFGLANVANKKNKSPNAPDSSGGA